MLNDDSVKEVVKVTTDNSSFPSTISTERNERVADQSSLGPNKPSNHDDQVRWFLVISTIILMLVVLVAFIITKIVAVLAATTIVGIAVFNVFRYYFTR